MTHQVSYDIIDVAKGGIQMTANIKISLVVPLVSIVLMSIFLYLEINVLSIIISVGALLIVVYYILGFIKRKDALVIKDGELIVTSPIKTRTFDLEKLKSVSLEDNGTILYGDYDGTRTRLITNIYDRPLTEIKNYLLISYAYIKEQTK